MIKKEEEALRRGLGLKDCGLEGIREGSRLRHTVETGSAAPTTVEGSRHGAGMRPLRFEKGS